eukprot:388188-Amphidinium_carterae.1
MQAPANMDVDFDANGNVEGEGQQRKQLEEGLGRHQPGDPVAEVVSLCCFPFHPLFCCYVINNVE